MNVGSGVGVTWAWGSGATENNQSHRRCIIRWYILNNQSCRHFAIRCDITSHCHLMRCHYSLSSDGTPPVIVSLDATSLIFVLSDEILQTTSQPLITVNLHYICPVRTSQRTLGIVQYAGSVQRSCCWVLSALTRRSYLQCLVWCLSNVSAKSLS